MAATSSSPRIAVIGAGIAGISAAYWLARKGASVTIYDQERYPAMRTSYANGSQLSVCNSGVWNTWPLIIKGLKWMLRKDAPLYISPRPDLAKLSWLMRFINVAAQGNANDNTVETIRLALSGRAAVDEIEAEEGIAFNRVRRGILHVYTDYASFSSAVAMRSIMETAGCEWTPVPPHQCRVMEPSISPDMPICGGIFTESDSTGDMHAFAVGLASTMERKYGCAMATGVVVNTLRREGNGVLVNNDRYDHVVVAAGVDTPRLARLAGDRHCIYPVKGYSITIDLRTSADRAAAPMVSLLDEDAKIVCSRLGEDRLRVAGTAELSGHNRDIRMHRIKPLLDWTARWFPGVSTRTYRPWAGLRPMTPNMLPIVGPGSTDGIWYHAGHGHLGWTIAPGTGRTLANLIIP